MQRITIAFALAVLAASFMFSSAPAAAAGAAGPTAERRSTTARDVPTHGWQEICSPSDPTVSCPTVNPRKYYKKHPRVPNGFKKGRIKQQGEGAGPTREAAIATRKPIGCRASILGIFGCIIAVKDGTNFLYRWATSERRCVEWWRNPDASTWYFTGSGQKWQPTYCVRWKTVS